MESSVSGETPPETETHPLVHIDVSNGAKIFQITTVDSTNHSNATSVPGPENLESTSTEPSPSGRPTVAEELPVPVENVLPLGWIDVIFATLPIIFATLDGGSDVYVATSYFLNGYPGYGAATTLFIILPNLISATFAVIWWRKQKKENKEHFSWGELTKRVGLELSWAVILCHNIRLSFRYARILWRHKCPGSCGWAPQVYETKLNNLLLRICVMSVIEGAMEALPQLFVQGVIVFSHFLSGDGPFAGEVPTRIIISVIFSCGSVSLAICSAYRAYLCGSPLLEHSRAPFLSLLMLFSVHLLLLGGRLPAIGMLFALMSWPFAVLVLAGHSCIMALWSVWDEYWDRKAKRERPTATTCRRTALELGVSSNQQVERPDCPGFGFFLTAFPRTFVMIFLYFILHEKKIHLKFWVKHAFLLSQTCVICIFWANRGNDYPSSWLLTYGPPLGYLSGLLFYWLHSVVYRAGEMSALVEVLEKDAMVQRRIQLYRIFGRYIGLGLGNVNDSMNSTPPSRGTKEIEFKTMVEFTNNR